jgi:hypothetical protein
MPKHIDARTPKRFKLEREQIDMYASVKKPVKHSPPVGNKPKKILDGQWCKVQLPYEYEEDQEFFDIEEDLRMETGCEWDTGSGFGMRDWELDWSLIGKNCSPKKVVDALKKGYPKLYKVAEIECHFPTKEDLDDLKD